MSTTAAAQPSERAGHTRERILSAAERLFAERGVNAVSNRQVSEAAGQGNNFAVGYHFGTKSDLVRAIVHHHGALIEQARQTMVDECDGSRDLRDWVSCLVLPSVDYLAALGDPTWYARFSAQMITDPTLRAIRVDEARHAPSMARVVEGLVRCLRDLPGPVRIERGTMVVQLVVHTCAEHERSLAAGGLMPNRSWQGVASGLIDAIVGMLEAPVSSAR